MSDTLSFLKAIDSRALKTLDRALAVLWFAGKHGSGGIEASEICRLVEQAGHPGQNVYRLTAKLASDRKRVSRVPGSVAEWRLHPHAQCEFDKLYSHLLRAKPNPAVTDSVLPHALFNGTRGYLEKVFFQINGSYDVSLFDCCAVMCRRLLETLIIEVYEAAGRPADIQGADGNFHLFADLLRVLLSDKSFNLSRNTQQGLKDFKKLGELSAHSRRYNAHRSDIDRVRDGIRVASEELLHLAKLI